MPISDKRLDYLMIEAKQFGIREPLKPHHEVFLGYILLNPIKEGMLNQKLQILASGILSNKTYKFELPILGTVIPDTKALQYVNKNEEKSAFPTPIVTFDISDYLIN